MKLYRFKYEHEFCGRGEGVYVEGSPFPFMLFHDRTKLNYSFGQQGVLVRCLDGDHIDCLFGITEWIDGPPPGWVRKKCSHHHVDITLKPPVNNYAI